MLIAAGLDRTQVPPRLFLLIPGIASTDDHPGADLLSEGRAEGREKAVRGIFMAAAAERAAKSGPTAT